MPESGVAVAIGRNSYDPPAPTVPVFDIHARSLVMHDSGAPAHSGILQYNSADNRLELIPGGSGTQPIVTAVYWDGYTVGTTTVSTSATTIAINTTRSQNPTGILTADTEVGAYRFTMAGTYSIEYRVSLNVGTTTRTSAQHYIDIMAPGGSYSPANGSTSYSYHRTTANGEDTGSSKAIITVAVDTLVRVRSLVLSGANLSSVTYSCGLTIRKLA